MTRAERESAIAQILAECGENVMSNVHVVQTTLDMHFSHVEIGPDLWAAVDEARAQLEQKEAA